MKVIQESEKVRIYRTNNRSSITKLKRPQGIIKGHKHCADLLNKEVAALLGREAELDKTAQEQLLDEVKEVFTAKDNEMLEAEISDKEVTESLRKSITFLVFDQCWPGEMKREKCAAARSVSAENGPRDCLGSWVLGSGS